MLNADVTPEYRDQIFTAWGIGNYDEAPHKLPDGPAWIEDYLWLVWSGETNHENISNRLRMKPASVARLLYKHGITPLHQVNHDIGKAAA
jgi:hypothetical protein